MKKTMTIIIALVMNKNHINPLTTDVLDHIPVN